MAKQGAYSRLGVGFDITSSYTAIDRRFLMTKAQMNNVENIYDMPDVYFCFCIDDGNDFGRLFIYNSKKQVRVDDEGISTGRYYPIEELLDFEQSEEAQEKFNEAINNSDLAVIVGDDDSGLVKKVNDIEDKIETIEINGGIVGGDE